MSGILESLNQVSAAAIAAVLNSLWQAVAVAAAAWAVMRFAPRMNAATRHALWWAVLAVVVLLPVLPSALTWHSAAPQQATQAAVYTGNQDLTPLPTAQTPSAPAISAAPLEVRAGHWPTWLLALWLAVLAFQMGRIAWSYRYLRAVKRTAQTADPQLRRNFDAWLMSCSVGRPTRLLVSRNIASPLAVGFRSPAVVLPEPILTQFQEPELDHVLLHELAHIARRDDWTNLSARLAMAIVGLHPVAAFVLRRIEREREMACDDWVVAMTGSARPYAASLARLFEVCFARRRMLLASPMAGRSSHLGERIEMLLRRSREFTPSASGGWVAIATLCLVAFGTASALTPHWLAFAQSDEPALFEQVQAPPQVPDAPVPPPPAAAPTAVPDAPAAPPAPFDAAPTPPSSPFERAQPPSAPAAPTPPPAAPPRPPAAPRNGSFLAALVAAGYGNLPVDEIIDMKNAGVSAEFLTAMNQAGWGRLSTKELIELCQQGVSPDYVRQIKDAGIRSLSFKDVIELSNSGVRPSMIRDIHGLGFGPYTAHQAVQLAQNGMRVDLFRALKDAGLGNASLEEIIQAHQVGLSPRDLREAHDYGSKLTMKQIIRLKTSGVI